MIIGLIPMLDEDHHVEFNKSLNILQRAAKKVLVEALATFKPKETLERINCRIIYLLTSTDTSVRHKAEQVLLKSTETDEYAFYFLQKHL